MQLLLECGAVKLLAQQELQKVVVWASWLRGVSALPNTFAHESYIDELATAAGVVAAISCAMRRASLA